MLLRERRNILFLGASCLLLFIAGSYFFSALSPAVAEGPSPEASFEVTKGEGFFSIADHLFADHLIRSRVAFISLAVVTGSALSLKPGLYSLSPSMPPGEILDILSASASEEVTVLIPEGADVFDIDRLLAAQDVTPRGSIIALASSTRAEGRLFPDTYRFFKESRPEDVLTRMKNNFDAKAGPLLANDASAERDLILASLVEKEVPDFSDQQKVAGIILKRLQSKIPLQIDATICYAKEMRGNSGDGSCYPLTPLDFKIDSSYNTYLYRGLPPRPIGNPGLSALKAALAPLSTPYWFYLSDPRTKKTIFSHTIDEHNTNRIHYLN